MGLNRPLVLTLAELQDTFDNTLVEVDGEGHFSAAVRMEKQPMIRPQVVYLAGPYRPYTDDQGIRHGIAENVRAAGRAGIQVWERGYVALVPHTLTYLDPRRQRQDGGIGTVAPEVFMQGELELVRRSDFVVMLPEWRHSRGASIERTFALEIGKDVYEWEEFVEWDRVGVDRGGLGVVR